MGKINVQQNAGGLIGLAIIETELFCDNCGNFAETYHEKVFFENRLTYRFVQDNEVYSRKGVIRGFHLNQFQPQAKLVRVLRGKIYDVVIDLRKTSATFKKSFCIELTEYNRLQLYIPEGFAHAYLALTDATILFKVTTHYIPGNELNFAWNSKEFGILWPNIGQEYIFNEKDRFSLDYFNLANEKVNDLE